jgi:hypothetical protein
MSGVPVHALKTVSLRFILLGRDMVSRLPLKLRRLLAAIPYLQDLAHSTFKPNDSL